MEVIYVHQYVCSVAYHDLIGTLKEFIGLVLCIIGSVGDSNL